MDKIVLCYHLKGSAFDCSPFSFNEKKSPSNNQRTIEARLQNASAGKAQSKQGNCFTKKETVTLSSFFSYTATRRPKKPRLANNKKKSNKSYRT